MAPTSSSPSTSSTGCSPRFLNSSSGTLPQQLNLHRQLANVALGGIQLGGQRLAGLLLQTELDTGH